MRSETATGWRGEGWGRARGKSSQDGSGDGNDGGGLWREEGRTGGKRGHRKLESWEKAKEGVVLGARRAQAPGFPVALPFGRAIGGAFLPANTYPGERGASCSLTRAVRVVPSSRRRQSFYIHTKTRVPRWWPPCGGPLGAGSAAAAAAAAAPCAAGWSGQGTVIKK